MRGGAGNDSLDGGELNDTLEGGTGIDALRGGAGTDTLDGGGQNDILIGGAGRDFLTGGTGADTFRFDEGEFAGLTGVDADRILDFSQASGDRIDLSAVDALAATEEDDAFAFIGDAAFSGTAGELRYQQIGGYTLVEGDWDGDGQADFAIRVDGLVSLTSADFVL